MIILSKHETKKHKKCPELKKYSLFLTFSIIQINVFEKMQYLTLVLIIMNYQEFLVYFKRFCKVLALQNLQRLWS